MNEIQGPNRGSNRGSTPATGKQAKSRRPAAADRTAATPGTAPASSFGQTTADEQRSAPRLRPPADKMRSVQERVARLQQELANLRAERARRQAGETDDPVPATPPVADGAPTPAPTEPQSAPEPVPVPDAPETAAPAPRVEDGITISGNIRQTRGAAIEDRVAVEESAVARERGIVGVRIDTPDEGVTFRFQDLGNGRVQATRYEIHDGQEVMSATQTLAITGAGDNEQRTPAPGTLTFDRLGLQLEIDDRYTPGDLHFVEISSGPSSTDQVAAGQLADPPVTATPSGAVATPRDLTLEQILAREQELGTALDTKERALIQMLDELTGSASAPPSLLPTSQAGDGSRDAMLRQLAETVLWQSGLTSDRVLQLLG